jgi:uncharacterized membrane protein
MDYPSTLRLATPVTLGMALGLTALVFAGFVLLRWITGRPIALARRPSLLAIRALIVAITVLILINPVRVATTPGTVERPKVVYLVDASQSMALGKKGTRWDQALATIRTADRLRDPKTAVEVSVFRFGSRLAAVDRPAWFGAGPERSIPSWRGLDEAHADVVPPVGDAALAPVDPDTILAGALGELTGRFGQSVPRAVILVSDGRARDSARAESIARGFGRMNIPIHVVPVGDPAAGGDVAIVSLVAPPQVRKRSRVGAQVFVRSFGYAQRRIELKLVAAGPDGASAAGAVLGRAPMVLQNGVASASIPFESGDDDQRIEARIDPLPGEASLTNNTFATDIAIDHTKIRVLYLEGAAERYVDQAPERIQRPGQPAIKGAYSPLREALMEDPDIECTAVFPAGGEGDFGFLRRLDEPARGLPESPSEWFAYDAIILSNMPREALSDQQVAWVDEWIARRGGGLAMVGGPYSFASGRWAGTVIGAMLPVDLRPGGNDWDERPVSIEPLIARSIHPIWHIAADDSENRTLLRTLPAFLGRNRTGQVKPGAELLAVITGDGEAPAVAAQPYGRGRTLVMTTAISRRWASGFLQTWGGRDARYYKKYWRNVAYWLTENSSIGRRRLLAETDKRLYSPGEPVVLRARTFDENAAATLDYRVTATVEPVSAGDVTSDDSPLRRPAGQGPQPGSTPEVARGPLLPWGEEFALSRVPAENAYTSTLPIAEARSLPAASPLTRGLRIELTAYEGSTQVDSTALDLQILEDPSEQQNPLPDHELLQKIASWSGGKVLSGPSDLAAALARIPVVAGPPEIRRMPAWSRWWLLLLLITLLSVEWVQRRWLGLA